MSGAQAWETSPAFGLGSGPFVPSLPRRPSKFLARQVRGKEGSLSITCIADDVSPLQKSACRRLEAWVTTSARPECGLLVSGSLQCGPWRSFFVPLKRHS